MYKIDIHHCIECGFCQSICPRNAINKLKIGYEINTKCIGCGLCAKRCPVEAIEKKEAVN